MTIRLKAEIVLLEKLKFDDIRLVAELLISDTQVWKVSPSLRCYGLGQRCCLSGSSYFNEECVSLFYGKTKKII